ncbi:MAG: hypothetical protein FWF68_04805 [Spirochaetes bacterium]|nr:hypothetical protein [Spirochaetota bacterium]
MEKTVFENLKKTKYEDVELSKFASWAIWDKDIENTEFIEKSLDKLNGNIVFVALNFGGKKPDDWKDWQNFHCKGRGDRILNNFLSKTEFKGAYMTDLIKDLHNSNGKQAEKIFENNETKRNKDIDFLFQEIEMLKTNNIEMYLFGEGVETLFKEYVIGHEGFEAFKQKIIKCQRIHHYVQRFQNFEKIASVQLNLTEPKNQIEKSWKYPPLWNNEQK